MHFYIDAYGPVECADTAEPHIIRPIIVSLITMSNEINTLMCIERHFLSNELRFGYTVYITRSRFLPEKEYADARVNLVLIIIIIINKSKKNIYNCVSHKCKKKNTHILKEKIEI